MSQSELPFDAGANVRLTLAERMATSRLSSIPKLIPHTDDRWVLASNLQKAIRRGLVPTAVATAVRLLTVDPRYFWRRLLVIAYEDIGFGDISLCQDLLRTFRREALHREIGPERVAVYFIRELANARKSRALCDAIAMLEFSIHRTEYERQCFALSDEQLVATACDPYIPIMNRIAALRHICGYRQYAKGTYRTVALARTELMREVSGRQELDELETRLFMSGQNVSESLNITLPMIAQMVRSTTTEQQAKQRFTGKRGILYASLDRHTRAGKRCFARLAKEAAPVREFFERHPSLDPVAVLGAGVFIIEGAELDRWLVFDGADNLRQMFNQNFLEHAGLAPDDQEEFLAVVRDNLRQLNHIRAEEIA